MQVRVDIYFRIATSDTQVKFEKGHRETEKQKNKEKEDPGKPHGREMKKGGTAGSPPTRPLFEC